MFVCMYVYVSIGSRYRAFTEQCATISSIKRRIRRFSLKRQVLRYRAIRTIRYIKHCVVTCMYVQRPYSLNNFAERELSRRRFLFAETQGKHRYHGVYAVCQFSSAKIGESLLRFFRFFAFRYSRNQNDRITFDYHRYIVAPHSRPVLRTTLDQARCGKHKAC